MMPLLLPQEAVIAEINASMEAQAAQQEELARHWTAELRRIDPTLEVRWVGESATEFDFPARWHVRKAVPDGPDEWFPLVGPRGEYREPGAWILDEFEANDMWNPRVHRSKREAKEKLREARNRAKQLEREQRVDEMAAAHRAALRVRGDSGMESRSDLKLPPKVAEERRQRLKAEGIKPR